MRQRVKAVVLAAALASTGLVVSAPSASAREGCVTRNEYHRIERGFRKERVHNIFEARGRQTSHYTIGGDVYQSREYNPCEHPRWGWVDVDYKNGKVQRKSAYWG